MNTAEKQFVVSRTFDAPRDLVWKAFSEAEALAQWWAPKGFDVEVRKLEFKPGGIFHYRQFSKGGFEMWGRFEYREIDPKDRIEYVSSFSDESAGITRAPFFDGLWPLETLNEVTFEESEGKTTVTLRGHPINALEDEKARYYQEFRSMDAGFNGTLDQLAAYLAREQEK